MGCDIHAWIEVKRDGKWGRAKSGVYTGRNYKLFAALAGVRQDEHPITPISEPRGLPSDCPSAPESDDYGIDGHSHSWLTLGELLRHNWMQPHTMVGCIQGAEYRRWSEWSRKHGEHPHAWCSWTSAKTVPEAHTAGMTPAELDRVYVRVEWTLPLVTCVGPALWQEIIAPMCALSAERPDDVRLVFFFDN